MGNTANETENRLLLEMAQRARALREELGLTINDLAVKMGRTYQCIHGMEREGILSLRVVLEWADALQVTPDKLAFGDGFDLKNITGPKDALLSEAAKNIDARTGPRKNLVKRIREEIGE